MSLTTILHPLLSPLGCAIVVIVSSSGLTFARPPPLPEDQDFVRELELLKDRLEEQEARLEMQETQLAAQRGEIYRLQQSDDRSWLTEQRAIEIRALVEDVLADADIRASLLQNGLTAGYDKHFVIGSADGNFLLQFYGKLQTRYIYNHSDQTDVADDDRGGFTVRRMELYWKGHVLSPDLTYKVKLAANRVTGSVGLDDMIIGYRFADRWQLRAGQFKAPFLREFLVSSGRQQAVERSYVNHTFNVNRTQGLQLTYSADKWKVAAMVHDGANSKNRDFHADRTDIALASRGELLLAGDWKQFKDFASWPGDDFGLMIGGAFSYESGETGDVIDQPDVLEYTADLSAEFGGWNVFAAYVGQHISGSGLPDADQFGLLVQAGAFVIPDKMDVFARYEYLDLDGLFYNNRIGTITPTAHDEISLLTVGMNYYFKEHSAKFSLDAVWALDPLPDDDPGAGLLASPGDDQVVLRAQFQLLF